MKICHVTSVHKWDDIRIFRKECIAAVEAGFDVTLLAVNASEGVHHGVKVVSVPYVKSGRLKRMLDSVNMVCDKALEVNADVYHLHDPELLRISSRLLSKGKKVIYDSHEDLPRQILDKNWIPSLFRSMISRIAERYENRKCSRLTAVVAATPHIAARFSKVNGKVVNVNNYPILSEISYNPNWAERKNEIVYIGGIFPTRGVYGLVESLQYSDTKLNLAGNYSPASFRDELIAMTGWKKVNEAGFVNRDGIDELLGRSRVGIVTLHPTKAYLDSLPIKMFEYMAAGIPVVASDFPYWRSIINKHNCGILVDPLDPKAIAGAVNDLLGDPDKARAMGERGREAALREYSWSTEAAKLTSLYKSL